MDGQQRLTSILLSKIGYFPNKEKFKTNENAIDEKNEGTDELDKEDPLENKSPIEWTIKDILISPSSVQQIQNKLCNDDRYDYLNLKLQPDFFENSFLGFSYIVPDSDNKEEIQKDFSVLFRNINYFGKKLTALESRRSLYYMDTSLRDYFDGMTESGEDVFNGIEIKDKMKKSKIDFVRYLSTLSQYIAKNEDANQVMKRYSAISSRETYFADYVSYIVGLDQESNFNKFDGFRISNQFPNNDWKIKYDKLKGDVARLKDNFELENNAFTSWIDADYWLYGLTYEILFKNKTLIDDISPLVETINKKIAEKRYYNTDYNYKRSPNRLGYLRERMTESINIYQNYVH